MNAIEENEFVSGFPCVIGKNSQTQGPCSVFPPHWETRGTWVTAVEKPATIRDFGGFRALYEVQYPAPSDPQALPVKTANW